MKQFRSFLCSECGHDVRLEPGTGRTHEYLRGVVLPIPDEFELPTCSHCGEIYAIPEVSRKLDALLRKVYLDRQAKHYRVLVTVLCIRHGVTQKDVEAACAVTPSYLSHVLAGRKQASVTLTRLIEAFVADGAEFDRHLAGHPWTAVGLCPFGVRAPSDGFTTGMWATNHGTPHPARALEATA